MDMIRYDRCPNCATQISKFVDLDELCDDDTIACPSCIWTGPVDELTSGVLFPYAPQNCPGFDPGNALAAYGGRRCQNCGMREPNGTETHPAPRHGVVQLQQHIAERSRNAPSAVFELPAYPRQMLEKFAAIQRELPIGTVLDWFKAGPENYTVVTGYELMPAAPVDQGTDNSTGAYFILHMSRADGTLRYNGTTMSFEEASTYTEKRVGMLSELATAEEEL